MVLTEICLSIEILFEQREFVETVQGLQCQIQLKEQIIAAFIPGSHLEKAISTDPGEMISCLFLIGDKECGMGQSR